MLQWEIREAEVMVQALAMHCRDNPDDLEVNLQLLDLQDTAEAAIAEEAPATTDLAALRTQLCALCRGNRLYACDVATGWSGNCTFVFANTTEFSSL